MYIQLPSNSPSVAGATEDVLETPNQINAGDTFEAHSRIPTRSWHKQSILLILEHPAFSYHFCSLQKAKRAYTRAPPQQMPGLTKKRTCVDQAAVHSHHQKLGSRASGEEKCLNRVCQRHMNQPGGRPHNCSAKLGLDECTVFPTRLSSTTVLKRSVLVCCKQNPGGLLMGASSALKVE